jgi:nucleotidyltransferase/DNA polymerase involved in DNA repair
VERLAELGFSEDMLEQLRLFGYATLDGVRRLTARQIEAQFGEEGARLHAMLHPEPGDRIPLYVPPPCVERWHEFETPVPAEPAMTEPVLARLIERAAERLRGKRCRLLRVGMHVEGEHEPRWTERVLSSPRSEADSLYRLAAPLLGRLLERSLDLERLAVQLGSLQEASYRQVSLFDERPAVLGAVRNVHRRYPGFIRRAVLEEHALFEEDEVALERFDDRDPEAD